MTQFRQAKDDYKVIIIDNYDSFTYNIVNDVEVITQSKVMVFKNDEISPEAVLGKDPTHLILSPGPGHPKNKQDFGVCTALIQQANCPILGVCLGHQGIAQTFSEQACVSQAIEPLHGQARAVFHGGHFLFKGLPSPFVAARYHSLIVTEAIGGSLQKIAWSKNGEIMAIAHQTRPIYGLQFHPESILTPQGKVCVGNFLRQDK